MKFKIAITAILMALVTFAPEIDAQRRGGGSRSRSSSSRSRTTSTPKATSNKARPAAKPRAAAKPKTASSKFDSKAATSKRRATSQKDFKTKNTSYKAKQTKNASRISGGTGKTYSRGQYNTRSTRQTTVVFNSYNSRTYPSRWGGYNDGISPFFWLWMMDRGPSYHSQYLYHHGSSMDQGRMNELYAKNADLQAQVNAMKTSGVAVNPGFVPEGMDAGNSDLMYTNDFAADAAGLNAPLPPEKGMGFFAKFMIGFVIVLAIGFAVVCLKV